jgi:hypothetical protein
MTQEERDKQFKEALHAQAAMLSQKNIPYGTDINTLCPEGNSVIPEEELEKLVKDAPCLTTIGNYREPTIIGKGLVMFFPTDNKQELLILNYEKAIIIRYCRSRESRYEKWEPWVVKSKFSLHTTPSEGA